jgi:hypothetical protein|tara:strand:- start:1611 stop:2114 length:504 start_codon:yes stop_codon:yes gene_type:complete
MNKVKAARILNFWMNEKLPTISKQRKHPFRPDHAIANKTWRVLNTTCFNDELKMPSFSFHSRTWWWALCCSNSGVPQELKTKSNCEIMLSDKWFCRQWFVDTLAHEMAHQYQWDVDGVKRVKKGWDPIMSHGPSFFKHKDNMKPHGIYLKIAHKSDNWFKYQCLKKC